MWENFFKHIDILPNNTHILDGNASDLEAECKEFERKIKEAGGKANSRDLLKSSKPVKGAVALGRNRKSLDDREVVFTDVECQSKCGSKCQNADEQC